MSFVGGWVGGVYVTLCLESFGDAGRGGDCLLMTAGN